MRLVVAAQIRRPAGFVLDVSFDCEAGSLGIVGPSGSGKTTLLDCIAGVERRGSVIFNGQEIGTTTPRKRRMGYVTQDALLFPHLNVRRNLSYGPRAENIESVARLLHIDHLLDRMPRHLSGGERGRVALARAIVSRPRALLLDEPFSGLDEVRRRDAMSLLGHVRRTLGIPIVLVSHRADEMIGLTDQAIRLENGLLAAKGASASVLRAGESRIDNYFVGEVAGAHRFVVDGVELFAVLPKDAAGKIRAACYAHDVFLASQRPAEISARNVLPVRIVSAAQAADFDLLEIEPPRVRVVVTHAARQALRLEPGTQAYAIIKATSIAYLGSV